MAPRRTALPAPGGLFESTGNRARQLAAGNPGTGGFNDRTATDFAAGIAGLNTVIEGIQLQRDSVKAVELETKATVDMQAELAKLNPLDKDYQTQVKAVTDEAKRRVMEGGITSSAVADDLAKRMDRHGAAMQVAAIGETKRAVNKQAILGYTDAKEAINAKIRNDPANANLYMGEFQADVERLKVGMDPVDFEVVSRSAADDFAKNQVIGYAEKGNFAAAKGALKAQAPHLKTEVVTGLSSYIDGKESKARADGDRARTANASTILLDIEDQFNGRKPIDPNTRERLDDMKAKGMISPEHHLMAVKTWNNENQRYQVDAQKNAKAAGELATGTLSSQENADRAFANQYGNIPFGQIAMNGTPEQKAAGLLLATTMASGSGYLPSQMKNLISNADNITDPKRAAVVAYAAEAMDELEAKAPGKIAGVTLSDTGVVNRTRAEAKRLIADGVPPAEARLMAAQTQMPKDKMTLQVENDLRSVATDKLKKMNPSQEALNALTSGWERNVPFVVTPAIGAEMGEVYARTFKEAWVATNGDEVRAKALADKKIAGIYGRTNVGVVDARQETAMTHDGFPARQNSDGSYSTELSITVTDPKLNGGKPTNIPSLWGGKEVSEAEAVDRALKSGKKYPAFGSINEAVKAAEAKSEAGGAAAPELGFDTVTAMSPAAGKTGMAGQGKVTIQAYPPEKYMKAYFPQMSDEQLAKMVMADLDAFNTKEKIAPAPSKDAPGRPVVQLAPDAATEADLRAGRPPSYEYRVLRGEIYEPVISGTTGKPVRYRIPSSPDQVKDNPAFIGAEKDRTDATRRKIDLDIELQESVPDAAADERALRMRNEGKKLKGNR